MTTSPTPLQVAQKLAAEAEKIQDAELQKSMQDGAETVIYLMALLRECASYIEDINEYDEPPRFIIAVREILT